MKVNARTTRPIVTAGSITRRAASSSCSRLIPSRNGMMARLARPGDQPPDVEQDHHGRPEQRHRPVPDHGPEHQDHEERDGDQVGGLVDLAEELLDPAELPPPDPRDDVVLHLDPAARIVALGLARA